MFAGADLLRPGVAPVTTIEAAFMVPVLMVAFAALAAIIGLHFSLLSKKTVQAVMISTAIVMGAAGLLWACGLAVGGATVPVSAVILPFTPFPAVQAFLDPWMVIEKSDSGFGGGSGTVTPRQLVTFRTLRLIFGLIAAAAYLGITFAVYKSMVRGFDMTVRRQSA
jgi:hypothetical protein